MDTNELNYFVNVLQKRISEYFNQSLMYEARFQMQNDIITKQNEKIAELTQSVQDYKTQIEYFDEQKKKEESKPIPLKAAAARTRKKSNASTTSDGGIF